MTHITTWPAGATILLTAVFACDSHDTPPTGLAAVQDSSGVTIVTNRDHGWNGRAPWALSDAPVLSIGEIEGGDEYQLFQVTGAVRLSDGSFVVANSGSRQLRFYDSRGVFMRASGGEGSGPGEFSQISLLRRYRGDSLFAYDVGQAARFSIFSTSGDFGRTGRIQGAEAENTMAIVFGSTDDGRLLVQSLNPGSMTGDQGITMTPQVISIYDPDGTTGNHLGEFPGLEFYRGSGPMSFGVVPFARMTVLAGFGSGVLVGTNDSYELKLFGAGGGLERIIRLEYPAVPVEARHIEQNKEERREMLDNLPDMFRQAQRDLIEEIPFPEYFPAYRGFRLDTEGNIWVEDYRPPGIEESSFRIFDAEGFLLGPVALPESFTALDIGSDYILGRYVDDLEVEYVRMYRLTK